MWQVVVTDVAEQDLLNSSNYISEILKAPIAAENLMFEAEKAIGKLAEFPFSCPIVTDEYFAPMGVRFLPIKNYLAFYVTNEETQVVSIIRFLYARRDWIALLKKGDSESRQDSLSEKESW